MTVEYRRVGEYQVPNIKMDTEMMQTIGKYGRMRMNYLQEHHGGTFQSLLLSGELMNHLNQVEKEAHQRLEIIMNQMKKTENITEELKATNQLVWIQEMNRIQALVEEIIKTEIIFN
ncbi:MAG TPA: TnpV protein [Lachnospiraceae bacterium]|nr:TnpV protein [Lachnospiraceae bacterium]